MMQVYRMHSGFGKADKCYGRLLSSLNDYDVISFDIFGTLLNRAVDDPKDIFDYVENKYAVSVGISDYKNLRIKCQRSAEVRWGCKTRLADIYKEIQKECHLTNQDTEILMEAELKAEERACYVNPTILEMVCSLKKAGKTVVLTSDMYLTKVQLERLLPTDPTTKLFDEIYVSCEIGKTKNDGSTFKFLSQEYPDKRIIHIGDYFKGDYINPKQHKNIDSIYLMYPRTRYTTLDRFLDCSVSDNKSEVYRWAYKEFAPIWWSFCQWLVEISQKCNCSQLLFLTREGDFLRQLFQIYYEGTDIRFNTLYTSRQSVLLASSDINWESIPNFFKTTTVSFFKEIFKIDDISHDDNHLTVGEWEKIEEYKSDCKKHSVRQRKLLLSMISGICNPSGDIGIIDVGWKGSTQFYLQSIFDNVGYKTRLHGFYVGEFYDKQYESLDKHGFICSSLETEWTNAVLNAGFIFENLLSPPFGSTIGYEDKGGTATPILENSLPGRSKAVVEIQKAVLDFFQNYKKFENLLVFSKQDALSRLFKHLNHPPYSLACTLGDIEWIDFDTVQYVARPRSGFYYLRHPKELEKGIHYCGWNSAFFLRAFKIPLPYFEIYSKLKNKRKRNKDEQTKNYSH